MSASLREKCRGALAAMLTPLTPDERLDVASCENLANALLDEGQVGLYVGGNTGEQYAIDDSVRAELFEAVMNAVRTREKKPVIIAHVGGVPTRRAAAMARAAADAGCDAVAAMTPLGGRHSIEELVDYYRTLAGESSLPLLAYHVPIRGGFGFSREQLSMVLELPNVAGVKYTSFDLFTLERLATLHPDKVILMGSDEMLMFGLLAGAAGGIGSTYNLIGPVAVKLCAAVERRDLETALRAQGIINVFVEALFKGGGLRGFKALAAERLNWPSAKSPSPGATPPPEVYAPMTTALDQCLELAKDLP